MKTGEKIVSLILSLAMVVATLSVLTLLPVNAAAGDVWMLNHTETEWQYFYYKTVSRDSATEYSITGDKGKDIGEVSLLLSNDHKNGNMALKSNTRYEIKFNICLHEGDTANTINDLYAAIGITNSGTWINGSPTIQSYDGSKDELNTAAVQTEWGDWPKWDITLTYDTGEITGNQYFVLSATKVGSTAITHLKNITVTEIGTFKQYQVVDAETGNILGTVKGFVDDDAYELIAASEFNKQGYDFAVEPEYIEETTEQLVVTYQSSEASLQIHHEVNFDENYGKNHNRDWHYIPEAGRVSMVDNSVKFADSTNVGDDYGNRAVLLANDYTSSSLIAGNTYRLTFQLSTFPQWTPLSKIKAEIRFGNDIWANMESGALQISGEKWQDMVTGYTTGANGRVTFTIATNITMPEKSKWASDWNKNVILSVYDAGAEIWVEYAKIEDVAPITVSDDAGNTLGTVYGLPGDQAMKIIPDSFLGFDCTYTASPEILGENDRAITLNKTLKENIVQKVNVNNGKFGSEWMYMTIDEYAKLSVIGDAIKGTEVSSWGDIANKSVAFTNSLTNAGLEAGEKYRLSFLFSTASDINLFEAKVRFGTDTWQSTDLKSYNNSEFQSSIVESEPYTYGDRFYTVNLDVTLPEVVDNIGEKALFLALYGSGENTVTYFLRDMYVYKQSSVNLSSYDETVSATVKGFEGDVIGEVVSTDGSAKFINVTDKFSHVTKNLYGSVIYRGDANRDAKTNSDDLIILRKYLLGVVDENGCDLFAANANGKDSIDIIDLIHLKKMIANNNVRNESLPDNLAYNDYALAWNYEFSDSTVDYDKISSQDGEPSEGMNYVTVGDKNCVSVDGGVLKVSPKYNYGHVLAANTFSTQDTMNFAYGYFEIRAKLPYNPANLTAIWFKSDGNLKNTLDSGVFEYDLAETFGSQSVFSHNVHYWDAAGADHTANPVPGRAFHFNSKEEAAQYHTYGFEWIKDQNTSRSTITLYVDGQRHGVLASSDMNVDMDFNAPMYLLFSNHIITQAYYDENNDWIDSSAHVAGESDFPMDMCIDYIRIYQSPSNTGNILVTK